MRTKFIILGSGSSTGIPRIDGKWGKCNKKNIKNHRTRCSAILIKGTNSILLDTSPDIKNQLLANKIKNVSSVLYSHEHTDQTNGLFELRPFFWKNKKKINIYGNTRTLNFLKTKFDFLFKQRYSYPAIAKDVKIKKKFSIGKGKEKILFKTLQVWHGPIKVVAYIFEKTAYISDCNDLSIVNNKEFKNLKYLIIDCLKIKKHPTHFNLDQVLYIKNKLQPKKTILTNLHSDLDYDFLLKRLPNNVLPAYDNLKIYL